MNSSCLKRGAPALYLVVFPLIGLVFSSCGTVSSGTRVSLRQSDLAKIKTIGVVVKKDKNFSVRLFRDLGLPAGLAAGQPAFVAFEAARTAEAASRLAAPIGGGLVLGGLDLRSVETTPAVTGSQAASAILGVVAVAGAISSMKELSSKDAQLEAEFKPTVGDYDPRKRMGERLRYHLEVGKFLVTVLSSEIENRNILKGKKFDAVLQVTLKEWGLRPCMAAGEAQVGVNVHGRVFLLEDGGTVWEREELYRDGECHPLEALRSREGPLDGILTRTIDNLAGKLANEILFP